MRAEANGQTVCPRAGAVVGRPRVCDQSAVSPKYVRCSRWREEEKGRAQKENVSSPFIQYEAPAVNTEHYYHSKSSIYAV